MTGETALVKKDTRLFLFQALKRGSFEGPFITKMKKDFAGMSFQFAKNYYDLTYEANLRQAFSCVMGIVNFGLIRLSGNNLERAVEILQTENSVTLFKAGWKELADLAKSIFDLPTSKGRQKQTLHDQEKDMAEVVSAEPVGEWIGLSEYRELVKQHQADIEEYEFTRFFLGKYAKAPINPVKKKCEEDKIRTCFFSLLISETPHCPLKKKEATKLAEKIAEEGIEGKFKNILLSFASQIPAKFRKAYQRKIAWLLEKDLTLPEFLKSFKDKGSLSLEQLIYMELLNEDSVDQISQDRFESAVEAFRGMETGEIISDLYLQKDKSDRMAAVRTIARRAYQLDAINLAAFLGQIKDDEKWQGLINWAKLSETVFVEIMMGKQNDDTGEIDVLLCSKRNEIIRDIFQQKIEEKMVAKFQALPLNLLVQLYDEVKECRQFLLKHIRISAIEFKDRWKYDVSVLFLAQKEWEEAWIDLLWKETNIKKAYKAIKREAKKAGLNQQEIYNLLLERTYLAAYLYKNREMIKDEKPPFYCKALKSALQIVLSAEEFKKIEEDLGKLLQQRRKKTTKRA